MNKLTAAHLKTIAIICMVIDHISWGFLDFYTPLAQLLHIIGRMTIPIMCYFIAEGFRKTSNLRNYISRMTGFALLSSIPFYLFFHEEYDYRQNIIFDLLLGLLLLTALTSKKLKKIHKIIIASVLFIISAVIGGWPILPMVYIIIFYYKPNIKQAAKYFCSATIFLEVFLMIAIALNQQFHFMHYNWLWYEKLYFLGFMLALIPLSLYNGKKGTYPLGKYFFYIFYPLHFCILYMIKRCLFFDDYYTIYVGSQLIAMLILGILLIRFVTAKPSKSQVSSVIYGIFALVYMFGFLMEITHHTVESAHQAVFVQYFGEMFMFLGLSWFIAEFCHIKLWKITYIIQTVFAIFIIGAVYATDTYKYFYKSMAIDNSGPFPRLILDYGPVFYIFVIYVIFLCIYNTVIIILSMRKSIGIEKKRHIFVLCAIACPWLSNIIRSSGLTNGYEISFVGILLSVFFVNLSMFKYGYFDSLQAAIENALYKNSEGLIVIDVNKKILYFNQIITNIFPKIHENENLSLYSEVDNVFNEETATITHNNKIYELHYEELIEENHHQGFLIRLLDLTEHYTILNEAKERAHIDALTGLKDRSVYEQEIIKYIKNDNEGSMFMLDVDDFKLINDNYGHAIGDNVLIILSECIKSITEKEHLSCRIGGDEFSIFFKNITDKVALSEIAHKLQLDFALEVDKIPFRKAPTISIGIATLDKSLTTNNDDYFKQLYNNADKALYISKRKDKNRYEFFEVN